MDAPMVLGMVLTMFDTLGGQEYSHHQKAANKTAYKKGIYWLFHTLTNVASHTDLFSSYQIA